jgi:hypothetical protein
MYVDNIYIGTYATYVQNQPLFFLGLLHSFDGPV